MTAADISAGRLATYVRAFEGELSDLRQELRHLELQLNQLRIDVEEAKQARDNAQSYARQLEIELESVKALVVHV